MQSVANVRACVCVYYALFVCLRVYCVRIFRLVNRTCRFMLSVALLLLVAGVRVCVRVCACWDLMILTSLFLQQLQALPIEKGHLSSTRRTVRLMSYM